MVDYRQSFVDQLKQFDLKTVDYIFCLNGANLDKRWEDIVQIIAAQGKICNIDELSSKIDLSTLKSKSVTYVWELMYTRSIYQTPDMIEQHHLLNAVADLVDAGTIQTTLTQRLSPITASHLRKAHALVQQGTMIGKIVLEQF